jgi:hypothetical protein
VKNFYKVCDMNVQPLVHALARQPELWNQNELRTQFPGTPHSEADDIWLWFNEVTKASEVIDAIAVKPYPAWSALPQARPIVLDLMRIAEASQLGRVIITRLKPGKQITPHVDAGAPVEFYKRYQVALQSFPGAMFQIEDEKVNFRNGEVWLINNKATHSVQNNSTDDRIVMIVDLHAA